MPETTNAHHFGNEFPYSLPRVMRHSLDGDLQIRYRKHPFVYFSKPSNAEYISVLEPIGGMEQVLVCESVWAEIFLPIFAHLCKPMPTPHDERDSEHRSDEQHDG